MDHSAIIRALAISAFVTTIVLSLLAGISTTTTPDGITTHHYTFDFFWLSLAILGVFIFPVTYVIGYPVALLLLKLRLFNVYVVSLVGVAGAIGAVSVLFSTYPPAPMMGLYYGLGGLVGGLTAYSSYARFVEAVRLQMPSDRT